MKRFLKNTLFVFILFQFQVSAEIEIIDIGKNDRVIRFISESWEYAGLFSLTKSGDSKLITTIKGDSQGRVLPAGKLDYKFFGQDRKSDDPILFLYIVFKNKDEPNESDKLVSAASSKRLISLGEGNPEDVTVQLSSLTVDRDKIYEKKSVSISILKSVLKK